MAANLHEGDDLVETSEINVTPFIDVILVLLIIFMVAAPLATVDSPVDLPVSTAKPAPRTSAPVFVTIRKDLVLLVGEDEADLAQLGPRLDVQTQLKRDERIFVRADQAVPFGELTRVMNALRASGYFKLAFVGVEGSDANPTQAFR